MVKVHVWGGTSKCGRTEICIFEGLWFCKEQNFKKKLVNTLKQYRKVATAYLYVTMWIIYGVFVGASGESWSTDNVKRKNWHPKFSMEIVIKEAVLSKPPISLTAKDVLINAPPMLQERVHQAFKNIAMTKNMKLIRQI